MGVRRLLNLVRHLPDDAATVRAATHGWTVREELAAGQLEVTHALLTAFVTAHGGKPSGKPFRVRRPYEKDKPRRQATADDLMTLFGASHG